MRRVFRAVLVLAFALAAALNASATPIDAVTANTAPGVFSVCGGFTCGWEFIPTTNISVVALGQYDKAADGLAANASVALWTDTGVMLSSAIVPAGTGATLSNGVRYVPIAPLVLLAGAHYVIGSSAPSDGDDYNAALGDFAPGITPVTGRFVGGGSLNFPTSSDVRLFAGPSFEFDAAPAAVPEPASMLLLGTGVAGLIARRSRNRRSRS